MNHLDDGTLQAFLDDELRTAERTDVAEHLLTCPRCGEAKEDLARANAVFAEAVATLDVPVPEAAVRPLAGARRGLGAGSFVKAASLVLLVAAAASAAVPGSPVRDWIGRAVEPAPPRAEAPATDAPAAVVAAPAPLGVSILPMGAVDVIVEGLDGTTLRLIESDGERVAVSALGAEADPVFRTAPDRIEVRDGVGGEVTIELPRSLDAARVVVDGDVVAEKAAGELRVLVPAATVDGARVWR